MLPRAFIFCLAGLLPILAGCFDSKSVGPVTAAQAKRTDPKRQVIFKVEEFT